MVRTQIQLTEAQASALKKLAAEEGRSMADLVRESVRDLLRRRRVPERSRGEKIERALAVLGKFRSGFSDLARNHDRYLDEAYGDWSGSSIPPR